MEQDPTDPTGVRDDSPRGNSAVATARARKSKAALALSYRTDDILSWDEIAERLGYPTGRHAQVAAERAAGEELKSPESRAFMRRMASKRLDKMLAAVIDAATNFDHPDHFAAQNQALKIIEKHMKLEGYEAPTEYVNNNPAAKVIEAMVAKIAAGGGVAVEQHDPFGEPLEIPASDITEVEDSFDPAPMDHQER